MASEEQFTQGVQAILEGVRGQLKAAGIEIELPNRRSDKEEDRRMKVVFVSPDLRESVDEMSESVRDQVVMVRVDQPTLERLEAWVATGAVKSKSEAAALFIREGLKVRQPELDKLEQALAEVEAARERLRTQAREVFGGEGDSDT
jgi:hypothetical protein